jgi:hypothetical protein
MIRAICLGLIIGIIAIAIILTASSRRQEAPAEIEPTPVAARCPPPLPPLLGPREGKPMFPLRRVESQA